LMIRYAESWFRRGDTTDHADTTDRFLNRRKGNENVCRNQVRLGESLLPSLSPVEETSDSVHPYFDFASRQAW